MPKGFRGWCHLCNTGFKTIEDLQEHNRKMINQHRQLAVDGLVNIKASAPADNKQSMAAIPTYSVKKEK